MADTIKLVDFDHVREKLSELLIDSPGLSTLFGSREEFVENADWLIANGVTFETDTNVGGKWISVTERLPELHTKVLCCGIKGGRFIAELGTWGHERHLYWDKKNGRGCPEVTHWMPLPEPPKEDER